MARPSKTSTLDLRQPIELTVGAIERLTCPEGKDQDFLRDAKVRGLRVRVTRAGAKTFVFESKLNGKTIRLSIGDVSDWSIDAARVVAKRHAVLIDQGIDPRQLKREVAAKQVAQDAEKQAQELTVGAVWPLYLANGRPKRREAWKPRYRADLEAMAVPGGVRKKRGAGLTRPGPLFPLLALKLAAVDEDVLKAWFDDEETKGVHQAARALNMFRGFVRWCSGRPEYRALIGRDVGKAAAIVEALPGNVRRTDALEAAQVSAWWEGVMQLPNPIVSAYLRALLLTGARREEIASLKWSQVDFRWNKLTIADKVDAVRVIPLTPYLCQMLAGLPRRSEWVFAAGRPLSEAPENIARRQRARAGAALEVASDAAANVGRIKDARASHQKALQSAGIERLTFHGLRRSFSLLGEAAGAPAGAIAQVMGHKPSATAEGYRPRSIDALRPYSAQIEAHVLKVAGVQFEPSGIAAEPGALRLVS